MLNRLAANGSDACEMIRQKVMNSGVIGTDETGMKINGKKLHTGHSLTNAFSKSVPTETIQYFQYVMQKRKEKKRGYFFLSGKNCQ